MAQDGVFQKCRLSFLALKGLRRQLRDLCATTSLIRPNGRAFLARRPRPEGRAFLSAVLLAISGAAFADELIGQASIIDGDTIEIHGARIRIFGIDAPESDQLCYDAHSLQYRCGQKASNALFDFVDRRPVQCIEVDRDRYKRAASVCTVGGMDIADWLVRNGLALD